MSVRLSIHFDFVAKNAGQIALRPLHQHPTHFRSVMVFCYAPTDVLPAAVAILMAVQGAAAAMLLRFLRALAQVPYVPFAWCVP